MPLHRFLLVLVATLALTAAPAAAHKEHRLERERAAAAAEAARHQPAGPAASAADAHSTMGEMMKPSNEPPRGSLERTLDWLGRLHPVIVHFPIAFFPAALFTAIVGRRRPAYAKPVQFLVVAGGLMAPLAALLGWLDGGFALDKDDALLQFHRWLGSGIGVGGLALALWAIRSPEDDRRPGMILALVAMTIAIVIQGWFGGAIVHGADHMNF
jgi:uncharacterized membrane protein